MHYIRILKPPRLLLASPPSLAAKITITTDLGESFLLVDVALVVELESEDGKIVSIPGKTKEFLWKGRNGMRSLEVAIPVPLLSGGKGKVVEPKNVRMVIRPREARYAVQTYEQLLFGPPSGRNRSSEPEETGGIVAVRSMTVHLQGSEKISGVGMAERVFLTALGENIRIWEETGESIARHIWYGTRVQALDRYVLHLPLD
jgi:hypothetical protein